MPRTIHDFLKDWGKKQQQLPARHDVLKSQVLDKFKPSEISASRRTPWLSLAFGSLAVLIFFFSSLDIRQKISTPQYSAVTGGSRMAEDLSKIGWLPWSSPSPISDPREFLKKDYNATIRTRHVDELANRIQTMVRGYSGRIDGYSSSEKNGYISFAIPANKLEAFRSEVRNSVRAKFYTENISTNNLLPQKQSIEEQQSAIENTLATQRAERDKLTADHKKNIASLQAQVNAINKELADQNTDEARKQQLNAQKTNLQSRIASENKNYNAALASLDAQIRDSESQLESIKKQDQNLLDNVATVQGYINLNWISLWEALDLYLPGPLTAWLLAAAAIAAYLRHRRQMELILPMQL